MRQLYDITIRSENRESFLVEADSLDIATTQALEKCIAKHPGCDVWIDGVKSGIAAEKGGTEK